MDMVFEPCVLNNKVSGISVRCNLRKLGKIGPEAGSAVEPSARFCDLGFESARFAGANLSATHGT